MITASTQGRGQNPMGIFSAVKRWLLNFIPYPSDKSARPDSRKEYYECTDPAELPPLV